MTLFTFKIESAYCSLTSSDPSVIHIWLYLNLNELISNSENLMSSL